MLRFIGLLVILTMLSTGCSVGATSTMDVTSQSERAEQRPPEAGGGGGGGGGY